MSLINNTQSAPVMTTTTTTDVPHTIEDHICKVVLYFEIPNTKIRLWDVIILVPNLMFLLFLIVKFNKARLKLRATNSPIFLTFYALVFVNVVISVLRCIVSISVNSASSITGGYADVVLWVVVRFFLLSTEISVVVFGLAFGHLDSRSSIRYVLMVTSFISLAFSISQCTLELTVHDENFYIQAHDIILFGHGGILFWFISSIIFSALYLIILILPWTKLKDKLALPEKKSFYVYITLLMFLNMSCSVGGGMLLYNMKEGLCIVDITTCMYFTFFTPLVYNTFLRDFFGVSQPNIMFSYKNQADDTADDDSVSLPHQQSFSSLKTDSEYIYPGFMYDNTQFISSNVKSPINPLYAASLQSPDSITGYSLDSQPIDIPCGGDTT